MANKVLQATFWYAFSDFLLKGLAFITTPIFSRILTKSEYGIFANYSTWYTLLAVVITLHLRVALTRARFDFENDIDSFITSILILGSLATAISGFIILINKSFFSNMFSLDKKYIYMMLAMAFVSPAYDVFLGMQRFYYKYKLVAITTITMSLVSIGLSLLLIMIMKDHLLARIIGSVAPAFVISAVLYVHYLLKTTHVQVKYWTYSMAIAIPYIFHSLSGTVLAQSDRVMITSFCGAEDTALYSMAYNVAWIVITLWGAMNSAFGPWLGEKLHAHNYFTIKKYSYAYLGVFSLLIVTLILVAPEALLFLGGEKYLEAKYVIPPVMAGCCFIFIYTMYVNVEQFEKRTKPMAVATFFVALLNVITNWLFIPIFGYIAAAYTTLFCYMVQMIIHYFLVRRMGLHIIYDTRFIITVSVIVCMIMVVALWLYKSLILRYVCLFAYSSLLIVAMIKKKAEIISYLQLR